MIGANNLQKESSISGYSRLSGNDYVGLLLCKLGNFLSLSL